MIFEKGLIRKNELAAAVNDDELYPNIAIEQFSSIELSKALQNSLCGIALIHRNGRIRWSNDVWESYTDLSEQSHRGVFLSQNLYHTNRQPIFKDGCIEEKQFTSANPVTSIVKLASSSQSKAFMLRVFGPMGVQQDLCMMQVSDISSLVSLKSCKATLHTIINGSAEPIFVLNSRGDVIALNTPATHLLNAEHNDVLNQNSERFFSLENERSGLDSIHSELKRDGWWEGTLCFIDTQGKKILEQICAYRVGEQRNRVRYVVIVRSRNNDETQEAVGETSQALRKLKLPQRKDLELQIDLAVDAGRKFGLLYILLNQNEKELIHSAAGKPALIKQVLENIQSRLPEDALISALSGSDLVAMLHSENAANLEKRARKLRDSIRSATYVFTGDTLFLNAQIGIVMSGNVFQNSQEYLLAAKTAAESAREANLHSINVVDPLAARRQKGIEGLGGKLKRALRNNEFFPVYEPFVDLKTMEIIGCEALVRWNNPENGIMRPGEFLPAIEAHGLMEELTEIMFFRTCRDFSQWQSEGCSIQTLSLNVTARDVDPEFLPSLVNRALHHSGLNDNFLQIEITEEGLVDHDKAISVIKSMRDRGVRVAIDDFGTGYSNLAYLKSLPVDALKIDRAFIMESTHDAGSRALIESINFLGKKLGLKTIAEGIESGEQRDLMSVVGVDLGQGYLFSTPKPARRFRQLLTKSKESE